MFENGKRVKQYSPEFLLPLSGKLLPEFSGRRSIKEMFSRKVGSFNGGSTSQDIFNVPQTLCDRNYESTSDMHGVSGQKSPRIRSADTKNHPHKRVKSGKPSNTTMMGQQKSLKTFFSPVIESPSLTDGLSSSKKMHHNVNRASVSEPLPYLIQSNDDSQVDSQRGQLAHSREFVGNCQDRLSPSQEAPNFNNIESWSRIFSKKKIPLCEEHNEPCVSRTTKKSGPNHGRSFWICQRPLGPRGETERGTEWRCPTFIWSSY